MDPGERSVELAARGEQLQRVQPHEAFGAQRRRDARVELVQVERLALQPRDQVVLGEAVLGLVVELDRHDGAGLRRQLGQHVGLQPPRKAARAQVPVQAQVRVGAAEALAELRARAEVGQAPEDPQLGDQLGRAVHHGRARQRKHEPVARDRRRQVLHRLGALRGRVLAVVGLVKHQGAGGDGRERTQACGDDVVIDDGHIGRLHRAVPARAGQRLGAAVRQPQRELAQPVQLEARRADDDRRVGVVGLERRERLDRLAETLLVGEERAALGEQVADPRALERLQLAAEGGCGLVIERCFGRARQRDEACGLGVLLADFL